MYVTPGTPASVGSSAGTEVAMPASAREDQSSSGSVPIARPAQDAARSRAIASSGSSPRPCARGSVDHSTTDASGVPVLAAVSGALSRKCATRPSGRTASTASSSAASIRCQNGRSSKPSAPQAS